MPCGMCSIPVCAVKRNPSIPVKSNRSVIWTGRFIIFLYNQPMIPSSFLIIVLAFGVYGGLHSLLAADGTKARAEKLLGPRAYRHYRLGYNLFSGLTLLPVLILVWRLPDALLWQHPLAVVAADPGRATGGRAGPAGQLPRHRLAGVPGHGAVFTPAATRPPGSAAGGWHCTASCATRSTLSAC